MQNTSPSAKPTKKLHKIKAQNAPRVHAGGRGADLRVVGAPGGEALLPRLCARRMRAELSGRGGFHCVER